MTLDHEPAIRTAPWDWRPDLGPWFAFVAERAATWEPSVDLRLNGAARRLVIDAALGNEAWVYHPALGAVLHTRPEGRAERDATLVAWLALHARLDGELHLAEPLWCWSPTGGFPLEAGTHALSELAAALAPADGAPGIAFDPWCSVIGYAYPDSIPAGTRIESEQEAEVRRSAIVALRAEAILRAALPDVADWLGTLAKVLVFLDSSENLSRSASASDLPGVVFADVISEIALLEVLVHESAHHLLYVTEAAGPLVDPGDSRRFTSPLRPDPRPLRGILLAYHALAFICAFYDELRATSFGTDVVDGDDLASLRTKMLDAEATLDSASDGLTVLGLHFVEATRAVARHAR